MPDVKPPTHDHRVRLRNRRVSAGVCSDGSIAVAWEMAVGRKKQITKVRLSAEATYATIVVLHAALREWAGKESPGA